MKRSQLVLKRWLSDLADFEEDEGFVSRLDFIFPAVNRFDGRQNIRASRKAFADQLIRNAARDLRVRKCAQGEQNSFRHVTPLPTLLAGKSSRLQQQRHHRR